MKQQNTGQGYFSDSSSFPIYSTHLFSGQRLIFFFFSGLLVMAHKGAAPACGEIRTGQSGVATVHLKT